MKQTIPAGLLLLAIFAGCTSPGGPLQERAPESTPPEVALQGTGAIGGTVVDTSLLPLANVTVFLEHPDAAGATLSNATTDEDGSFRFLQLAPGVYRIRATLAGFGDGAALATVIEDETAIAQIVLHDVPSQLPYLEVQQRTGIFRCAFALVLMPTRCDEALEAAGLGPAGGYRGNFTISAGHMALVLETNWGARDTTMDVWSSYVDDHGDWKYFPEVRGVPILRLELFPGQESRGAYSSLQDPDFYGPVPASEEGFRLNTETTYIGQFQEEADAYLNPVCEYTWGNCTGAGAVFDFRFDQFASTFYNAAPADVSSYSAIPRDG